MLALSNISFFSNNLLYSLFKGLFNSSAVNFLLPSSISFVNCLIEGDVSDDDDDDDDDAASNAIALAPLEEVLTNFLFTGTFFISGGTICDCGTFSLTAAPAAPAASLTAAASASAASIFNLRSTRLFTSRAFSRVLGVSTIVSL